MKKWGMEVFKKLFVDSQEDGVPFPSLILTFAAQMMPEIKRKCLAHYEVLLCVLMASQLKLKNKECTRTVLLIIVVCFR